jgi:uncharacterized protein (DUF4415 family)
VIGLIAGFRGRSAAVLEKRRQTRASVTGCGKRPGRSDFSQADKPRHCPWQRVDNPPRKEAISIKIDQDVLAFFRRPGRGHQTRINAVRRRYMRAQRKAG